MDGVKKGGGLVKLNKYNSRDGGAEGKINLYKQMHLVV